MASGSNGNGNNSEALPSKIANSLSVIQGLEKLTGNNYFSWRENLDLALAMAEIDYALLNPKPVQAVPAPDGTAEAANNAALELAYSIKKTKWENSNKKCLMVIKGSIIESIRGAIPECTGATVYLQKIADQFTGSTKTYAGTIIKTLINEKYNGSGLKDGPSVREHILKPSNMAHKLTAFDMPLKPDFTVHLALASLPKDFENFVVNYNISPEKWTIEKCIAMCVQEEERLKAQRTDDMNLVKHNQKKKNFYQVQNKPNFNKGNFPKGNFQQKRFSNFEKGQSSNAGQGASG